MRERTALLTGGGGAIAAEIAPRLDARGYRLILVDIDEQRMAQVAAKLSRAATCLLADLSDPSAIQSFAARVATEHPDLDLLVNNAGVVEPGDIADLPVGQLDRHINVNLLAPMHLSRAAAQVMRLRGRGDIVTIVSMGGIMAMPGSAPYSASKAGLRAFQTSIRMELAPYGVRVMGVFPSAVDTRMLHHEALHGGAPVTFVTKPRTAAEVADAVMDALTSGRMETYVPYSDSVLSRALASVPWSIEKLHPFASRLGERAKKRFIADRHLA